MINVDKKLRSFQTSTEMCKNNYATITNYFVINVLPNALFPIGPNLLAPPYTLMAVSPYSITIKIVTKTFEN